MKLQEIFYVLALVACALLATAENGCGGAVDAPPLEDDAGDAGEDAPGCICVTCIYPAPMPCDAAGAEPKP